MFAPTPQAESASATRQRTPTMRFAVGCLVLFCFFSFLFVLRPLQARERRRDRNEEKGKLSLTPPRSRLAQRAGPSCSPSSSTTLEHEGAEDGTTREKEWGQKKNKGVRQTPRQKTKAPPFNEEGKPFEKTKAVLQKKTKGKASQNKGRGQKIAKFVAKFVLRRRTFRRN
jgi:hypothetical protein